MGRGASGTGTESHCDSKSRGNRKMHGGRGRGYGRGDRHRGGGRGRDGGGGGSWNKRWLMENMSGFLCTCNMNEKDCVKEAFNILNEYVREGDLAQDAKSTTESQTGSSMSADGPVKPNQADNVGEENLQENMEASGGAEVEDDDIEAALAAEIKELKSDAVRSQFFSVGTGVPNLVFIKSSVKDPATLAHRILEDISTKKQKKARFLLRLLPIELTCMAKMDKIEGLCRKIFPKYFSGSFTSFQVVYKSRYNGNIDRGEIIKLLADIVCEINPLNVVDLTAPKFSIIVEVIKNIVCIGVLTDFNKFKKYNLHEAASDEVDKNPVQNESKNETGKTETEATHADLEGPAAGVEEHEEKKP